MDTQIDLTIFQEYQRFVYQYNPPPVMNVNEELINIAGDALIIYIIDIMRFTEEEMDTYMETDYNDHLHYVFHEWINDIYEKIFCENYSHNDYIDVITLEDKVERILYWKHKYIKDSDEFAKREMLSHRYINTEYTYFNYLLENIFPEIKQCCK